MNEIELIIQNSGDGTIYDISKIAGKLNLEDKLSGSPKKLTFVIKPEDYVKIENGSVVRLLRNGIKKFYGYVFTVATNEQEEINITAYDQTRYLKNKDTFVFGKSSIKERLTRIANTYKLKVGKIEGIASTYKLPEKIYDDKNLGDMLQDSLDLLLRSTGKMFILKDNFGELEVLDVDNLKTNLVVMGGGSLLSKYSLQESIDSDTYNRVKLVKDNKNSGKRDVFIVEDSNNIKKYGLLQLYEVVDENSNDSQIRDRADKMLRLYNSPKKKLTLTCIGNDLVEAGSGLYLFIKTINGNEFDQYVLVTSVSHNYEFNEHNMTLEVEVE